MSFGFDPSIILGATKTAEPSLNDTLQTLGQLATGRVQQQHVQAQLADMARKQQDEATLANIYRSNAGAPGGLPDALMRGGFGPQAFAAQDQASQMGLQSAQQGKLLREVQDAQRKHVGELFYGTKDDADYQARRQELSSNPDPTLSMYAHMLPEKFDPAVTERLGNLAVPAVERAKIAGRGNGAGQVIVADDGTQYVANKQTGAATTVRDESGKAIKARPKGRGGAAGGGTGGADGLTPEALDAAAQNFLTTKEMPQLGAGKASFGLRVKIMNRALELSPGADLATSGAEYKANTASLKKLQTTADAVDAFENTAGKNLDTFLELAKGMGDTGSPLFNAPYRKFLEGVKGDPRMAGVSAARATAIAEIGKVLSGGTGGAALTEGTRHEVEQLIKPDATLAQIQQAANVLKRDMANRKAAVQEQLGEIQKRISGKAAGKESDHGAVTKHEYSKSRNKTRLTYADGHQEIVDGQR